MAIIRKIILEIHTTILRYKKISSNTTNVAELHCISSYQKVLENILILWPCLGFASVCPTTINYSLSTVIYHNALCRQLGSDFSFLKICKKYVCAYIGAHPCKNTLSKIDYLITFLFGQANNVCFAVHLSSPFLFGRITLIHTLKTVRQYETLIFVRQNPIEKLIIFRSRDI